MKGELRNNQTWSDVIDILQTINIAENHLMYRRLTARRYLVVQRPGFVKDENMSENVLWHIELRVHEGIPSSA